MIMNPDQMYSSSWCIFGYKYVLNVWLVKAEVLSYSSRGLCWTSTHRMSFIRHLNSHSRQNTHKIHFSLSLWSQRWTSQLGLTYSLLYFYITNKFNTIYCQSLYYIYSDHVFSTEWSPQSIYYPVQCLFMLLSPFSV